MHSAPLGLTDPAVTVTLTETLERQTGGKLRRFVRLNGPHQDRGAT